MIVPADDSWMEQSEAIEDFDIRLYFLTQETFFTGDPNNIKQFDDPAYKVPIKSTFADGHLRLAAFDENREQLIAYYREVAELAENRPFSSWRHYFWMRFAIIWGEDGAIGFPWHDTWAEMERVVKWIETSTDEERFDDIDQGWDVIAVRKGDQFFMRVGEGYDGGEVYANARLPAEPMVKLAMAISGKAEAAIAVLAEALGADVWTRYRYDDESPQFGTSDWDPRG